MDYPEPLSSMLRNYDWDRYIASHKPILVYSVKESTVPYLVVNNASRCIGSRCVPNVSKVIGFIQKVRGNKTQVQDIYFELCFIIDDTGQWSRETPTATLAGSIIYEIPSEIREEMLLANMFASKLYEFATFGDVAAPELQKLNAMIDNLIALGKTDYLKISMYASHTTPLLLIADRQQKRLNSIMEKIIKYYTLDEINYVNKYGETAISLVNSQAKKKIIEDAIKNYRRTDADMSKFPHTTVNNNDMPAEARDIINATDENISEFIATNPRNKIFKFMDVYHAINADDFETYFLQGEKKNENTFYSCKRVIGGLGVGEKDVHVDNPLFSLRNMGFTDYVSMDIFESVLQSPNQYFEIIREGAEIAPSLSSYYSIHGPPAGSNERFDLSSRFHCQEGVQSNIYKIAILDITSTDGIATREHSSFGGKKTKKQINKRKKKSRKLRPIL